MYLNNRKIKNRSHSPKAVDELHNQPTHIIKLQLFIHSKNKIYEYKIWIQDINHPATTLWGVIKT